MNPLQLIERVCQRLKEWGVTPDEPLMVGASGGVDSMVLLDILLRGGYRTLHVAHVNYGLRGADSEADAALVRDWAGRHGIRFHLLKAAGEWRKRGESVQAAARRLRHEWFARRMEELGIRHLALAHHRDDLVETILWQWLHAATPWHARGFLPTAPLGSTGRRIVRPLWDVPKDALYEYAHAHGVPYREDHTNRTGKFQRNYLRHYVIPLLKELNPSVERRLLEHAETSRRIGRWWHLEMGRWAARHVSNTGSGMRIEWDALQAHPVPDMALAHVLAPYGFSPGQAADLVHATQPGRRIYSRRWVAERTARHIEVWPHQAGDEVAWVRLGLPISGWWEWGALQVKVQWGRRPPTSFGEDAWTAWLDAAEVPLPWTFRRVRPGDRFHPLGMKQVVRLSDFLTNRKVPRHQKEQTWVLDTPRGIAWVLGHRPAHWARIRPSTVEAVRIEATPYPSDRSDHAK